MSERSVLQPMLVGIIAALVGFTSTFPVVLRGLTAVGANEAQAASGLMAVTIAMGIGGILMSFWLRQPVSAAWSTPGAALMASTGSIVGGWPGAVGAFLIAAGMLVLAGLVKPLGRAVGLIPTTLASAMLAGVIFGLCLAPVRAFVEAPAATAVIFVVWLAALRWRRLYATPLAAVAAALVIAWRGASVDLSQIAPAPIWVSPAFSLAAFVGLALPLFIVTMASQNLPGIAVLKTHGFTPPAYVTVGLTGAIGALAAPFGSPAIGVSAITAGMCASPDAAANPNRRWIASATCGAMYVALGAMAGAATKLAATAPVLVQAVAGLALLGTLGASLAQAVSRPEERDAALVTFLVAASGASFYGIGGAFWGLVAGGAVLIVTRVGVWPRRPAPTA
jgi:benzoate membrane transport protein